MQDVKPDIKPSISAPQAGRGGSNASKTAAAKRNQGGSGGGGVPGKGNANLNGAPIYPIESLSPYQNKCVGAFSTSSFFSSLSRGGRG